jgi:Gpi18-like mannosyltransferase
MITREKEVSIQLTLSLERTKSFASIWREALLPYLGTRLVLVLVGLLIDFYILPLLKSNPYLPSVSLSTHFPDTLWLMWRRFDAGFYVDIAEHGYWPASTLHTASDWIFLPLYPMLIYPFGHLFGGSDAAFDIAGILVSNTAAVIAAVYLYLLVRHDFGSQIATRTNIAGGWQAYAAH